MELKRIEGTIWILIGAVICAFAYGTGLGTFHEPGAGFVAFVAGLLITVLGFLVIIFSQKSPHEIKKPSHPILGISILQRASFSIVYTVTILLFYAFFLNWLGYIVTTFIALFFLFLDPVRRSWLLSLFAASVSVSASYLVFEVWLKSQLPRGILPWW